MRKYNSLASARQNKGVQPFAVKLKPDKRIKGASVRTPFLNFNLCFFTAVAVGFDGISYVVHMVADTFHTYRKL